MENGRPQNYNDRDITEKRNVTVGLFIYFAISLACTMRLYNLRGSCCFCFVSPVHWLILWPHCISLKHPLLSGPLGCHCCCEGPSFQFLYLEFYC